MRFSAPSIRVLLLVLCCAGTTGAFGQFITEADLLQPTRLLSSELSQDDPANEAAVWQRGRKNELLLEQFSPDGFDALPNIALTYQDGRRNEMLLSQVGSANELYAIQVGNDNLLMSQVEGWGNQTLVQQLGNGNEIQQSILNSNQILSEFTQLGNDNLIIQEIQGMSDQQFHIIQQGDGMEAIIRQSQQ